MSGTSTAPTLDQWLTTQQVADHFDIHPRVVLRMIREGRLQAVKFGWQWVVHRSQLPATWPPPVAR